MTTRDFRFGVNLFASGRKTVWQDAARRVEDLGYDVLSVPDHLGMNAPFPALVSAAEVTSRVQLGTLVLNAGFYQPALLAREVAGVHELTDGRFELGLGAGYVAEEFAAAELPFPSAGERIDHLERLVTGVGQQLAEAGHRVPVLIAGSGARMLTAAARHADIVQIAGVRPKSEDGVDPLAAAVDLVRTAAGDRFDQLELSLFVTTVHITGSGEPDLSMARTFYPELSEAQLRTLPSVLIGTEQEIADKFRQLRETYGISFFSVIDPFLEPLAKVISQLR